MNRDKANKLLQYIQNGYIDAYEVLENVLTNYMSADDADDFAESEYLEFLEDECLLG